MSPARGVESERGSARQRETVGRIDRSVLIASMSKAQEYRKQAKHCRDIATRTTDRESRDHLLGMAQSWERLATDLADAANQPDLPPPRPLTSTAPSAAHVEAITDDSEGKSPNAANLVVE